MKPGQTLSLIGCCYPDIIRDILRVDMSDSASVPSEVSNDRPTLLRWNDYLTGRSCIFRITDSDVRAPLSHLASKYLTGADASVLTDCGMILPKSAAALREIQDLSHLITDQGTLTSLLPGTVFRSGVRELTPREVPPRTVAMVRESEVGLIDLTIDRSETGYTRNWPGFNRRRWERSASTFESFVEASMRRSCTGEFDTVLAREEHDSRIKFLKHVARAIWDAPFENYSRFTGNRFRYKTGDEALMNIIDGHGAICSEKVQALKFVADQYGFESHYVLAGPDTPGPAPTDRLRHILDTFDFRGAAPAMRYWQHMALEFVVDDERVLVDATNGNVPFMFMRGAEVEDILDDAHPEPVVVKMGTYPERFYYHRAPDDLALDLCYAMENFIPEIDLVQVFDNELGLSITSEYLVAPLPYASDADFDSLSSLYRGLAEPNNLEFETNAGWQLDGSVGTRFQESEPVAAEKVMDSFEHLLNRYNLFEDEWHEVGLAIIHLIPDQ